MVSVYNDDDPVCVNCGTNEYMRVEASGQYCCVGTGGLKGCGTLSKRMRMNTVEEIGKADDDDGRHVSIGHGDKGNKRVCTTGCQKMIDKRWKGCKDIFQAGCAPKDYYKVLDNLTHGEKFFNAVPPEIIAEARGVFFKAIEKRRDIRSEKKPSGRGSPDTIMDIDIIEDEIDIDKCFFEDVDHQQMATSRVKYIRTTNIEEKDFEFGRIGEDGEAKTIDDMEDLPFATDDHGSKIIYLRHQPHPTEKINQTVSDETMLSMVHLLKPGDVVKVFSDTCANMAAVVKDKMKEVYKNRNRLAFSGISDHRFAEVVLCAVYAKYRTDWKRAFDAFRHYYPSSEYEYTGPDMIYLPSCKKKKNAKSKKDKEDKRNEDPPSYVTTKYNGEKTSLGVLLRMIDEKLPKMLLPSSTMTVPLELTINNVKFHYSANEKGRWRITNTLDEIGRVGVAGNYYAVTKKGDKNEGTILWGVDHRNYIPDRVILVSRPISKEWREPFDSAQHRYSQFWDAYKHPKFNIFGTMDTDNIITFCMTKDPGLRKTKFESNFIQRASQLLDEDVVTRMWETLMVTSKRKRKRPLHMSTYELNTSTGAILGDNAKNIHTIYGIAKKVLSTTGLLTTDVGSNVRLLEQCHNVPDLLKFFGVVDYEPAKLFFSEILIQSIM